MSYIKQTITFILLAIANKFIKDNIPSLHISNIIAVAKKIGTILYGLLFLLLIRIRIIKLSNTQALALGIIAILCVLAIKFKADQKKVQTA